MHRIPRAPAYHAIMPATLIQLSTSKGGMPKLAVPEARVTRDGVGDDWQLNRKYHGGCDRAVCIYSVELYDWLRAEHEIDLKPGSVGENFTTLGLDLQSIKPGDRMAVGNCVIQISKVRVPCRNLSQWHPNLLQIIQGRSGWMARVVKSAVVRPGDRITARIIGGRPIRSSS
jgi:MOSC domain-containing protein YiiM